MKVKSTFLFCENLKESFYVVSFGNDVHKNVVRFPGSFSVIVIDELCRFAAVESLSLVHVFFLLNVLFLSAGKSSS